ncbi:hypothetical protein GCM10011501_25410 [Thalassotalea profundi]|uniref:DUF2798 domain-containing protein n=2 Tax=Thalassotalea profundi TaxID=2036687 RepID=A0ABQ3IWH9_9GAMM|nr:hypothetical protein GCM10011501_25410 [Thalassotalea profundi]
MAVIMESIMAIITVLNNHSDKSYYEIYNLFFKSLLYALPIGLTFSCLITLVIKPKIEKCLSSVTG